MIVQRVQPNTGAKEGKWVAATICAILLLSAATLPFHQSRNHEVTLETHQISISDITQSNLSLLAELKLAHEEIRDLYAEEQSWPSVTYLREEWVAPFVEDQSWHRNGQHHWEQHGNGLYIGLPQHNNGAGAMLLDASATLAKVWVNDHSPLSLDQVDETSLKRSGWRLIVNSKDLSSENEHHW
ncbi:hypothetical protein JCM19235_6035 [Vibrio maritimus]|uniref:Uncharacterized protein n=1 Tax=Vibrio maritimus TaxID=990268 RepID=A0A090RQI0_9VIBR|nr:hypothetical protein JCM19235_6035 [Vibrio maritimus]